MSTIAEIFETMEYGPAPESPKPAQEWLEEHGRRFGLFIDGAWRDPAEGEYFDSTNPASTRLDAARVRTSTAFATLRIRFRSARLASPTCTVCS